MFRSVAPALGALAVATLLGAAVIGSVLGLVAAMGPRRLDTVVMRGADMLLAFPLFILAMGIAAGVGFGWFAQDRTVGLLATLGIVSLFLFAGLEVDFPDLRRGLRVLVQHVLIGLAMVALVAPLVRWYLDLAWRPAVLVALALLTPSTGFILDSLATLEISERERFWVKSKAVATELVALAALPSRDQLLGRIMFLLQSPAQRIAQALAGTARNLAVVTSEAAKAEKFAQ